MTTPCWNVLHLHPHVFPLILLIYEIKSPALFSEWPVHFLPTFFLPSLHCLLPFLPMGALTGTFNDLIFCMLICLLSLSHFRGKKLYVTFRNSFGVCPQRALLLIASYQQNFSEEMRMLCAFHQHVCFCTWTSPSC